MPKLRMMVAPVTLALLIAGCNQKGSDATPSAESSMADMASDAVSDAAADVKEAVTPTPSGQEFADTAAKSDAFEIAAAKLAKKDAASPDIKSFAAMMITDHTASTAKIKKAASAADPAITPNPALTDDQNQELAKLGGLSGADFDKEYVRNQVDAHTTALALLTVYADHGEVPSLKAAAGEIKPVVQMHLDKIKDIQAKLP
jgi:putative membrane protein